MLPVVLLFATLIPSGVSCKVPLLTRSDSGFAVVVVTIEEGRTKVFARRAGARDVLTVLMPLGPGLSEDIVKGPVLDMFKGQVPLNPGDVSTTLEVRD